MAEHAQDVVKFFLWAFPVLLGLAWWLLRALLRAVLAGQRQTVESLKETITENHGELCSSINGMQRELGNLSGELKRIDNRVVRLETLQEMALARFGRRKDDMSPPPVPAEDSAE